MPMKNIASDTIMGSEKESFRDIKELVSSFAPGCADEKVAYSVLFGAYDSVPKISTNGVKHFLFTDSDDNYPQSWNVIRVRGSDISPQRLGRYFKILGHLLFPYAKKSLYFDASFDFFMPSEKLISDFSDSDFSLFYHGKRVDYREEASACIDLRKDDPFLINRQVCHYEKFKIDYPSGCYSTGILLRNLTNNDVMQLNDLWAAEVVSWSVRDQISLPICFRRLGVDPNVISGDVFYNDYAVPRAHVSSSVAAKIKRQLAINLYRFGLHRR